MEMLRPTATEMLSGLSATEAMKRRILQAVEGPRCLPQVAAQMLGGLEATPALRHRILIAAERAQPARTATREGGRHKRPSFARLTPVFSMALVLTLMIGLGVRYAGPPLMPATPTAQTAQTDLGSGMAGGESTSANAVPQFRSLFVGEGANPPLIGIHGRYYQLLDVPVASSVVGTLVAEVQEHTDEPSLAGAVGVVSNIAPTGTQIYAVADVSQKTACIAEIDGTLRLFQRVGYASGGVVGNELFEDTLDVYNKVSAIELSGVGTVTDEQLANDLVSSLHEFSVLNGNDLSGGDQAITIYLRNGLSLQLMVNGDIISGCGAWACPEFFNEFVWALQAQSGEQTN